MTRDEVLEHIGIDSNICFGKPCIKGHRIWVTPILDFPESGWSIPEILESDPGPEEADIRTCGDGIRPSLVRVHSSNQRRLDSEVPAQGSHARTFSKQGHSIWGGRFAETPSGIFEGAGVPHNSTDNLETSAIAAEHRLPNSDQR